MKKSDLKKLIREIISEQQTPSCVSNTDFLFHAAVGLDGTPNIEAMISACEQLGDIPNPSLINDITTSCCEELLDTSSSSTSPPPSSELTPKSMTPDEWWNSLDNRKKEAIKNKSGNISRRR